MPEKYGSARRSSTPRDDNACSHDRDPHSTTTSQYDQELLEAIFQDLQNLKQFTGLTEPDPTPEGAGFNPAHDLSPAGEENTAHSHLSPAGEENHCSFPSLPRRGRKHCSFPSLPRRGRKHCSFPSLPRRGETQRGGVPTPANQAPEGAGFKPAHDLSPAGEDTSRSNLSPAGGETQRGGIPTPTDPSTGRGRFQTCPRSVLKRVTDTNRWHTPEPGNYPNPPPTPRTPTPRQTAKIPPRPRPQLDLASSFARLDDSATPTAYPPLPFAGESLPVLDTGAGVRVKNPAPRT